jgi:2-pyrone-4,6-dicarboxylate lactonase
MPPEIPVCLSPDRNPRKPDILLPEGSVDTHIHIFEPAYDFTLDRGYTPPEATLEQLRDMHDAIGVDRVVFTQPSVYGTDNAAMMDGVDKLNAQAPGTARAVVSCNADITDPEIEAFDARGARGLRFNMDNAGGMSVTVADLPALAERIAPFGWHMEFLFAGSELDNLAPVFSELPVPVSIAHFAYQTVPAGGVEADGFQLMLDMVKDGNTWIKISGANRVSASGMPPFDDVKPMAEALISANEHRIVWGTDWPHPNIFDEVVNDADLVNTLGDWVADETLRRKVLVENPTSLYRF